MSDGVVGFGVIVAGVCIEVEGVGVFVAIFCGGVLVGFGVPVTGEFVGVDVVTLVVGVIIAIVISGAFGVTGCVFSL